MTTSHHLLRRLLPVLFTVSGVSALIYQLVWLRELGLLLGTTVYAISIVLAAFMAGLALGSLALGRYIDRHARPVRVYAVLELLIACYGLLTPWLFALLDSQQDLFVSETGSLWVVSVVRFVCAFIVVATGALLIGGTLPVMVRMAIDEHTGVGQGVGLLYGLNTLGAVMGVALSGFWLIPAYGVQQTLYIAAGLNVMIFLSLIPWLRHGRGVAELSAKQTAESDATLPPRWVLLAFGFSGFIALAYEVVWTRVLSWVMGNSVYAVSILLVTFLVGLALGSLAGRWLLTRWAKQARMIFAMVQLGIALAGLLVIVLFGQLPEWFMALALAAAPDFMQLMLAQVMLAMLIMLPACLLLGTVFPLACYLYGIEFNRLGAHVGRLYAANTLGAIIGSLVAGFILIPGLGSATTLTVLVVSNAVLAAWLLWQTSPAVPRYTWPRLTAASGLAGVITIGLLLPSWDPLLMNSNFINQLKVVLQQQDQILSDYLQSEIVYQAEDATGHVLVYRDQRGSLNLHVNGRAEGGTSEGDMNVQVSLAAIPGLMHAQPRHVLLVGLGPGITLGTLSQLPDIERIDVVEMSSAVVKANHVFRDSNHEALQDPRVRLIVDDARHYLAQTRQKYDLIIVGPSYTWVSGAANLFTREFIQATRQHLNDGGLMTIWFPVYAMTPDLIRVFMQTLMSVYPENSGWLSGTFGELVLIGALSTQSMNDQLVQQRMAQPAVRHELARAGIHSASDLVGQYLMGQQTMQEYTADAVVNTDDRPILEFAVPQQVYAWDFQQNLQSLFRPEVEILPPVHEVVVDRDGAREIPLMALRLLSTDWSIQANYVIHYNFIPAGRHNAETKQMVPYRSTVPRLLLSRDAEHLEIRAVSFAAGDKQPDEMYLRHTIASVTGVPMARVRHSRVDQRHFYWVSEHQQGQAKYVLSWYCAENDRQYLALYAHQQQSDVSIYNVADLLTKRLHCIVPE